MIEKTALAELDIDRETINRLIGLVCGRISPEDVSESAEALARRSLNRPSDVRLTLTAIDDLLDTHGIECIEVDGEVVFEYCNTGDSYYPTVAYDHRNGLYLVASWHDLMEDL